MSCYSDWYKTQPALNTNPCSVFVGSTTLAQMASVDQGQVSVVSHVLIAVPANGRYCPSQLVITRRVKVKFPKRSGPMWCLGQLLRGVWKNIISK